MTALPPELVAAIDDAAPGDPSARLVAADWLQQHDEVAHGELIAAAIDGREENAVHVAQVQARLSPPTWTVGWRWGFIERLAHRGTTARDLETLAALLATPATAALRSLALDAITFADMARLGETLARLPPTLRELHVVANEWRSEGPIDLAPLWSRLPRLEKLVIELPASVGVLALPALAELDLRGPEPLAVAQLPRLAALRIGAIRDDVSRLAPITGARFPALERLAVAVYQTPAASLLALPIAGAQLRSIDVIGGPASERDRRRFPLDRDGEARAQLAGLVDLGHHHDGTAGRFYPFDAGRGRFTLGTRTDCDVRLTGAPSEGEATIEHTGVDWWLRDGSSQTTLNRAVMIHARLRAGDTLERRGHVFRLVGDAAELAAIRARTNLY